MDAVYIKDIDPKKVAKEIEEIRDRADKLESELMNFFLLGEHKSKHKSVYEMSVNEYLNLTNKL